MADPHFLGPDPKRLFAPSAQVRKEISEAVLQKIEGGPPDGLMWAPLPFRRACWGAGIDPELFAEWMRADDRLKYAVERAHSNAQTALVAISLTGGKAAAAAISLLAAIEKDFSAKPDLARSLEGSLEELEKLLPIETFKIVVDVLERHV